MTSSPRAILATGIALGAIEGLLVGAKGGAVGVLNGLVIGSSFGLSASYSVVSINYRINKNKKIIDIAIISIHFILSYILTNIVNSVIAIEKFPIIVASCALLAIFLSWLISKSMRIYNNYKH